jgi:acyl-CoA dehydrogenase
MNFDLTPDQQQIRETVLKLCAQFDDHYWLARDKDGRFPEEFCRAIADGGWVGTAVPEIYGGSGLGTVESALVVQAISESGAANSGVSAIAIGLFGLSPILKYASEAQRLAWLPRIVAREDIACFGVTEPNAGLDTTSLETRAERTGDGYVIHGQKHWTSMAQRANKVLLLARTTPKDQCKRKTDGLSLFYTDLDRRYAEVREIPKMGRKAVDSNAVFYDGMPVPMENLIGEEGKGFHYILHGLNPERVLIAAEAIGLGRAALARATQYARDRVVFGRPIGQNQGIQHPLAKCWAELEAADLLVWKAASMYSIVGAISTEPVWCSAWPWLGRG